MAKKMGLFGSLGSLFRVIIIALAAILVFAIWQNYNQPDVIAETDAVAGDGDQPLEQALEAADTEEVVSDAVEQELENATNTEIPDTEAVDVREEIATETGDAVEAGSQTVQEAEAALSDAAEAAEDQAQAAVSEAADAANQALENAEETVAGLAADAETAANDLLTPDAGATSSTAAIKVPGDDAVYALIETTRADDGSLDVITQRAGEGMTLTLSRVTCEPLALGVVAAGGTRAALVTDAEPDMIEAEPGTPEAALAAYVCGEVN